MAGIKAYIPGGGATAGTRKVLIAVICLFAGLVTLPPTPAMAQVCVLMPYPCTRWTCPESCNLDPQQNCEQSEEIYDEVTQHTEDRFDEHEEWMVDDLFLRDLLPQMKSMTEQLSAVAMQQVQIIGTFFDAKHQLETQRLFQEMAAKANHDYTPSAAVCTIGSSIRSLASSERNGDLTMLALSKHALERQLRVANANATEGGQEDLEGRIEQFRRVYCDPNDNNGELLAICGAGTDPERRNKDIDYARTLAAPTTLQLNFSDNIMTADEEDILALSSFLYSHDISAWLPEARLRDNQPNIEKYYDTRSVTAQRSVAQHSFNTIAAMKTAGQDDADTARYLRAVLVEMGMTVDDVDRVLAENPSYYAQMGILTKAMFQRPEFYVGLYDKNVNVARKGVSLQAISTMQKRDIFKSTLRSEAMISVLLELELLDQEEAVQNSLNRLRDGY
jgi:hypothetical protein